METKDLITIGISMLSLTLSVGTLYLTQFRPSKVTADLGPLVHIFYANPGLPLIFLPVVFQNSSPTKAIVYKTFLEIVDTKNNHFALKWLGFVEIDLQNEYKDKSRAVPFKIDGYEAIAHALRFEWINLDVRPQLDWLEGEYAFTLHVWTSVNEKPNYSKTEKIHINAQVAKIMADKKASADNRSRFLPFEDRALISFTTGQKPVNFKKIPR